MRGIAGVGLQFSRETLKIRMQSNGNVHRINPVVAAPPIIVARKAHAAKRPGRAVDARSNFFDLTVPDRQTNEPMILSLAGCG
jgi:hypothetical protein